MNPGLTSENYAALSQYRQNAHMRHWQKSHICETKDSITQLQTASITHVIMP